MLCFRHSFATAGICCALAVSVSARPLPVTDGLSDNRLLLQPVKAMFRPVSEVHHLAVGNPPGLLLPAFDSRWLLQEDQQRAANGDKRMRVGVVLPVGAAERSGAWLNDGAGGKLWVMDLSSANAFGLRVHFDQMALPLGATLSVQSLVDPSLVSGPFQGDGDLGSGEAWSTSLRGPSVRIEYHLTGEALEALKAAGGDINNPGTPFRVADVAHMYIDPNAGVERATPEGCVDVRCVAAGDALKNGVSRVNYVENGGNFICTGELLNTYAGDFTPYYITANHCFNTQASATTAEFVWNWYQNSCNGSVPDYFTRPRSRVATQLSSGATSDYSFMLIEGALPTARLWQGFDPNFLASGSAGFGVHCPFGGVMSHAAGTANYTLSCSANSHIRTNYNVSGTEPGSSGSGWYDASSRFRAQLHCGFSHCASALSSGDDWGRFDVTFPNISTWLNGGSDDASEPNDTCATARAVVTGTYNGRIVKVGSEDWYSISVAAGQRIVVTFNFTHDYGDIDAQLYNACGGTLVDSSSSTSNVETLDWSNYGGSATVKIHAYLYQGGSYPDTRNQYSMTIQLMDAPPQNDTCANVRVISTVPYSNTEDNSNAAADGPPGSCNSGSATTMQNSIWYRWTAPTNCTATLRVTDLTNYDMIVAVYSGASCASLTQIACGDEPEPIVIDFPATAATTYWFQVGDWGIGAGGGNTQVQLTTNADNDTCLGARVIASLPATVTQNNSTAGAGAPPGNCNAGGTTVMQNNVWYQWTADKTCHVFGTLTDLTAYDMTIQVYAGACDSLTPIVCGDEPEPITFDFIAYAGTTYYFQFGDWGFSPGGGNTQLDLACRPINDECVDAITLNCNTYSEFDNTYATDAASDPLFTCRFGGSGHGSGSVWYKFVASGTTARLFTGPVTGGNANDTLLAAYVGTCGNLIQIACNDDIDLNNANYFSELNLAGLTAGNTYYVQVAAWGSGNRGAYTLSLECPGDCVSCPPGAYPEAEACGANTNGGCNSSPAAYEAIPCGATLCGTGTFDGFTRDTDFFSFTVESYETVQFCATAQFDITAGILGVADDCFSIPIYDFNSAAACTQVCVSATLAPGSYSIFVAPSFTNNVICNDLSQWKGAMTITPSCPGDFNADGQVTTADLTQFLLRFGRTVSTCSMFDFNHDGVITTADLTQFLLRFGRVCVASRPAAPLPLDPAVLGKTPVAVPTGTVGTPTR